MTKFSLQKVSLIILSEALSHMQSTDNDKKFRMDSEYFYKKL